MCLASREICSCLTGQYGGKVIMIWSLTLEIPVSFGSFLIFIPSSFPQLDAPFFVYNWRHTSEKCFFAHVIHQAPKVSNSRSLKLHISHFSSPFLFSLFWRTYFTHVWFSISSVTSTFSLETQIYYFPLPSDYFPLALGNSHSIFLWAITLSHVIPCGLGGTNFTLGLLTDIHPTWPVRMRWETSAATIGKKELFVCWSGKRSWCAWLLSYICQNTLFFFLSLMLCWFMNTYYGLTVMVGSGLYTKKYLTSEFYRWHHHPGPSKQQTVYI